MAASYFAIAVTYLFLPKDLKVVGPGNPAVYYPALVKHPHAAVLLDWQVGMLGFFGIAVVLAVSHFSRRDHGEGWIRYTSTLALFGFAILSVDSLKGGALHKMRAEAWVHGDASTRAAIGATRLTLDYYGWFAFGAVGAWVLAVNIAMIRNRQLPVSVASLGIVLAAANEVLVLGWSFSLESLMDVGVGAGLLAAIPWLVFVGLRLRRASVRTDVPPAGARAPLAEQLAERAEL
ncbi:hypothetical protein A5787_23560 [Mycobacterium sp. 852002-50816_SCH5313054-b]|nr:hypothetical protein A5787_23560 [Mycobacterium sp. 852002-50816_SCH5313054-b]